MQGTQVIAGGQHMGSPPNQQQQIFMVNNGKPRVIQLHDYSAGKAKILGYTQVVLGLLVMLSNVGAAIAYYNSYWLFCTGFWGAPFIISAGATGVASSRYKTRTLIKCTLAFSIVSCMIVPISVTQGALSITIGNEPGYRSHAAPHLAMNIILIIAGIIEAFVAIYQSILCCTATCECCREIQAIEAEYRARNNAQPGDEQFVYYNNGMVPTQQQFPQQSMPQQQFTQQPTPQQQYAMQSVPQQQTQQQYNPQVAASPTMETASFPPSDASAGTFAGASGAGMLPMLPTYDDVEREHSLEMDAKINEWAARELSLGKHGDLEDYAMHHF